MGLAGRTSCLGQELLKPCCLLVKELHNVHLIKSVIPTATDPMHLWAISVSNWVVKCDCRTVICVCWCRAVSALINPAGCCPGLCTPPFCPACRSAFPGTRGITDPLFSVAFLQPSPSFTVINASDERDGADGLLPCSVVKHLINRPAALITGASYNIMFHKQAALQSSSVARACVKLAAFLNAFSQP